MIEVLEVTTKQQLKDFLQLPLELYKNCPQYVPDFMQDVRDLLNPQKNPALKFCSCQAFVAYKDNHIAGRVIAIINPRANQIWHRQYVRFGYIDFIDDPQVSAALLNAVTQWGRLRGMTEIQGPMGFTDYDKEGMLIGDYHIMGTMATFYNHPYYKTHMELHGFRKEVDWIQIKIEIPRQLPDRFLRVAELVKKRLRLRVTTIPKRQMYGERGHQVFRLLNQAYAPLFGFVPFNDEQIDTLLHQYVPLLNSRLMPVVYNSKDELIGVAITLPRLSRALQKSRGQLWPFGWYHLLKSLRWKHEDTIELMLIGVRPDYHGLGVNSLFFEHLIKACARYNFKYAETCPQLETNLKELLQWKDLNPQYIKPRRCWRKDIS